MHFRYASTNFYKCHRARCSILKILSTKLSRFKKAETWVNRYNRRPLKCMGSQSELLPNPQFDRVFDNSTAKYSVYNICDMEKYSHCCCQCSLWCIPRLVYAVYIRDWIYRKKIECGCENRNWSITVSCCNVNIICGSIISKYFMSALWQTLGYRLDEHRDCRLASLYNLV